MLGRLSALTALAMMLACGGDPAPLEVQKPRQPEAAKKKHKDKDSEAKKREEQERADEDEREARKRRMRIRERDEQEDETPVAAAEPAPEPEPEPNDDKAEEEERVRKKEAELAAREAKKQAAFEAKERAKEAAAKKKKKSRKSKEEADEDEDTSEAAEEEAPKRTAFRKKKPAEDPALEEKKKEQEARLAKMEAEEAAKKSDDEAPTDEEEAPPPKKKLTAAQQRAEKKKAAAEAKAEKKRAAEEAKAARKKAAEEAKQNKVAEEESEKRSKEVDESEIEVDTASLPPPDPSEESNELDLSSTPTRVEEVAPPPPPELAIDRRPLTLGRNKIELHGGLRALAVTTANGMGGTTTASTQGLALGGAYGLGAHGEVGVDYTVGLHPGNAKGPFLLHGAYLAKHTEKLDIALSLGFAVDFIDSIDPTTMMTTTRAAKGLQVGVWARYHLGEKLSAFTGLPALPSSPGSLSAAAPLPPIGYQLSIGLSSRDAIALDLPAGIAYQASPKLYTFASLDLAHLGMSNATSAVLFSDFIPLSLGGFYAKGKMDIGATFADDLKQGTDYLRFDLVVRYSLK